MKSFRLFSKEEVEIAGLFAKDKVGRSIVSAVYAFDSPYGPSRCIGFAKGGLLFESLVTEEHFTKPYDFVAGRKQLTSEMEIIAWAAR